MPTSPDRAKRVLIVDDEPTLVFFLMQGLRESEILYDVNSAASAEEALTKLTLNQYDLLITDLKMPGVNGLTLIEVARSLHPDIKVILMTAYGSREVRDEVARLQVDGYLTKPFPTAKLRDMATNILLAQDKNSPNLVTEQDLPSTLPNGNRD
jgi:two-component system response regulator (stage 0 sporulation protein F)